MLNSYQTKAITIICYDFQCTKLQKITQKGISTF